MEVESIVRYFVNIKIPKKGRIFRVSSVEKLSIIQKEELKNLKARNIFAVSHVRRLGGIQNILV